MKILAIDDNQDNLIGLKALIKDTFPDALTLTALNGRQGLELAAVEDPDVILLDIIMPDIDGFEVCEKLKADQKLGDIPVVFMTALKGDRETRVRAMECGADAFLSKPIDETELIVQIRAMVKIKTANIGKRDEKKRLVALVEEQTRELMANHESNLNLMEDLRKENEARRNSEEILRETCARMTATIDALPDRMFELDRDGRIYDFHTPAFQTLYVPPEMFMGKTMCEFLPEESVRIISNALAEAADTGHHHGAIYSLPINGELHWFELSIAVKGERQDPQCHFILLAHDITERKRVAEALKESEERVLRKLQSILSPTDDLGHLELSDIIDVDSIQVLMDEFYKLTRVPNSIIDLKGKILVATGWQDICTKFHRVHPETRRNCIECDTVLNKDIKRGTFKTYMCKNGLWDCVTPLMIGDRHIGNLFTGQFFFEREKPDDSVFRAQAAKYGFDEEEYMEAVRRVPVWNRKTIDIAFSFYTKLANMITSLSHGNIALAKSLEERRRTDETLKTERQQLRTLIDNLPDRVYVKDTESRFVVANEAMAKRVGLDNPDQLIGKTDADLCPDDLARQYRADELQILREGVEIKDKEEKGRNAKDETQWSLTTKVPLRDESGAVIGLVGIGHDITDRKKIEAEIKRNSEIQTAMNVLLKLSIENREKDFLDGALDLLLSLKWLSFEPKGAVFLADELKKILHLQVQKGFSSEMIKLCSTVPFGECFCGRAASEKTIQFSDRIDDRHEIRSGEIVPHGHYCVPILADDHVLGVISLHVREGYSRSLWEEEFLMSVANVFATVIERKRMEDERNSLEQQLRESQKMQAVGQLAGGISHDFNNLLSVINGYSQVLLSDPNLTPLARENLEEILKSGERASGLTRQLLVFSRRQPTDVRIIDLDAIISDMEKMLAGLSGKILP